MPAIALAEVSGTPVELLADNTLGLFEGKTSFRLHRTWLLAITKYAGGPARTVYLRRARLDGVTLEQRYEAGPGPGPHAVLIFQAGDLHAALSFEGSDKPYRAFAEKVLLQSGAPGKPAASPRD